MCAGECQASGEMRNTRSQSSEMNRRFVIFTVENARQITRELTFAEKSNCNRVTHGDEPTGCPELSRRRNRHSGDPSRSDVLICAGVEEATASIDVARVAGRTEL